MTDHLIALTVGFILDLLLGDPEWLYHPVCIIGKWVSFAEKKLRMRGGDLRKSALVLTGSTVPGTMLITALILWLLSLMGRWPLMVGMALLDWMGLAVTSMVKEARDVKKALETSGTEAGRLQVARIVGRDTAALDDQEIIKATIETVAENTTDGVISPMLWAALGGPVLLWGFKAASTLDSMVGYMDDCYRDIGWSSAKLDDILNYIPARLTALLMCAVALPCGLDATNAWHIVKRDHANHLSPNCGWSESAAAGSMHIQLGGTHTYFGKTVEKPTIGDEDRPAVPSDIISANRLLYASASLMLLLILAGGLLF